MARITGNPEQLAQSAGSLADHRLGPIASAVSAQGSIAAGAAGNESVHAAVSALADAIRRAASDTGLVVTDLAGVAKTEGTGFTDAGTSLV
jgi:hypothetical protein